MVKIKSLLALAIMGMIGSGGSAYRGPALKPRQWHDPERLAAAQARQAARGARNLRHADAGGYGSYWLAS